MRWSRDSALRMAEWGHEPVSGVRLLIERTTPRRQPAGTQVLDKKDDSGYMSEDGRTGGGRLRRAVILEDQPDLAALFTLQLQALGWLVDQVSTEAEAVAAASDAPPDAIIIDTLVPAADGRALIDRLRAGLGGRPCRLIISTIYEPSDFADVNADAVLALPHHRAALEYALLSG